VINLAMCQSWLTSAALPRGLPTGPERFVPRGAPSLVPSPRRRHGGAAREGRATGFWPRKRAAHGPPSIAGLVHRRPIGGHAADARLAPKRPDRGRSGLGPSGCGRACFGPVAAGHPGRRYIACGRVGGRRLACIRLASDRLASEGLASLRWASGRLIRTRLVRARVTPAPLTARAFSAPPAASRGRGVKTTLGPGMPRPAASPCFSTRILCSLTYGIDSRGDTE